MGQQIWHWKEAILNFPEFQIELNAALQNKKNVEKRITDIEQELNSLNVESEVSILINQVNLPDIPEDVCILYIDDMAEIGWSEIFCSMVFNKNIHRNFKSSKCLEAKNDDDIINKIVSEIKIQKTEIVLLDLRLKNETGKISIDKLGGYKILEALKSSFPGLHIIITSATNNAQNIKALQNAGADAVWTKPGIDELLSADEIVKRYTEFLEQIHYAVYKFQGIKIKEKEKALEKLAWTKFRITLYENDFVSLDLKAIDKFTDIYVDTNFLLSDYRINLVDSISNLYKLAYLKGKKLSQYIVEEKGKIGYFNIKEQNTPTIIIMNQIIDETIKISKSANSFRSIRAQFAYQIVMDMFAEKLAQTEINGIDEVTLQIKRTLFNPKENVHADGFILDEIGSYLVTGHKKFKDKYCLRLDNKILLLITDDSDLIEKALAMSPNLTIWNIDFFNNAMNNIKI